MRREIDTFPTPAYVKPKKLVVLSAPRSGTRGLYLALKQLGFAPYHMAEVISTGIPALKIMVDGMKAEWLHEGTPYGRAEFDKWFANYDVIIEMPFFMLRSTLEAYPDAKFLLTERDPEKWAESFMNTIGWATLRLRRLPMSIFKRFDTFAFYMDLFNGQMVDYYTNGLGASEEGRKALAENYKLYISEVKQLVPPEQLKVVELEDGFGWSELCPYLGVPIPDTPWPSLNSTEEFQEAVGSRMKKAASKGMAGVAGIVVIAAVAMWYGRGNLFPMLT
ncbi:hypothetical protein F4680DRAFT_378704 [Xylaria scruposa]|nr:hypothetical protein F4680DRAFT_378704 [Xylaria scruposa]